MTCQECEVALGLDEDGAGIEQHLAGCRACSELAMELRANAEALHSMAYEEFAPVRIGGKPPVIRWRGLRPLWPAVLAAAAAIVLAIFASLHFREEKLPAEHYALAPMKFEIPPVAPPPPRVVKKRERLSAPLMVKMLTADPNVVIYWRIDGEQEGMER